MARQGRDQQVAEQLDEQQPPAEVAAATAKIREHRKTQQPLSLAVDTCFFVFRSKDGLDDINLALPLLTKLASQAHGRFQFVVPTVWDREISGKLNAATKAWLARINQLREAIDRLNRDELRAAYAPLSQHAASLNAEAIGLAEWRAFCEKAAAEIIALPPDSADQVLEMYFQVKSPFEQTDKKKYEFPDAFALISLERNALDSGRTCVVVTRDAGARRFCNGKPHLIAFRELKDALAAFDTSDEIIRFRHLSIKLAEQLHREQANLQHRFIDRVNFEPDECWPAGGTPWPAIPDRQAQASRILVRELTEFSLTSRSPYDEAVEVDFISSDESGEVLSASLSCEFSAHVYGSVRARLPGSGRIAPQSFPVAEVVRAHAILRIQARILINDEAERFELTEISIENIDRIEISVPKEIELFYGA